MMFLLIETPPPVWCGMATNCVQFDVNCGTNSQRTHVLYGAQDTMYSSFFNYLLVRLPPRLVQLVLRRLSGFACGAAMPSMALEAAAMYKTSSVVAPAAAVELVVLPLMNKLQAEMPEPGEQGEEGVELWDLNGAVRKAFPSIQC